MEVYFYKKSLNNLFAKVSSPNFPFFFLAKVFSIKLVQVKQPLK